MSLPTNGNLIATPLMPSGFGALVDGSGMTSQQITDYFERYQAPLKTLLNQARGLLVIRGLGAISGTPEILPQLSRIFGPRVENYRETITTKQFFHESIAEILVLSNRPPCSYAPPPRPEPACTQDGGLPIRYPQRSGWHTDQSYRRPPPDISLLYGVTCPPPDQGQTLYCDGTSAYAQLDTSIRERIENLYGIHTIRWIGRSRMEVEAGAQPKRLQPHQRPQHQPVVRRHPDTGIKSLYLCDPGQMDFIDGPFAGLEPGLEGAGAQLLDTLVRHMTQPEFVYVHRWQAGDLVIHDNRNVPHTATWYDAEQYNRLMWRTTVMGNPGDEYAGESPSWIPAGGINPMAGLEDLEF